MSGNLTREDMDEHLISLAYAYWSDFYPRRNEQGFIVNYDINFLNELKPLLDQQTEDAKGILHSLLHGKNESDIRWIIDTQKALGGASFGDTLRFCGSFDLYIGKGLMKKPNQVKNHPEKLLALYQVTNALLEVQTGYHRGGDLHPLVKGQNGAYYINSTKLIQFIMDHPEHGELVADSIRQMGVVHYAAIEHLIAGGTKSVSAGSL